MPHFSWMPIWKLCFCISLRGFMRIVLQPFGLQHIGLYDVYYVYMFCLIHGWVVTETCGAVQLQEYVKFFMNIHSEMIGDRWYMMEQYIIFALCHLCTHEGEIEHLQWCVANYKWGCQRSTPSLRDAQSCLLSPLVGLTVACVTLVMIITILQ